MDLAAIRKGCEGCIHFDKAKHPRYPELPCKLASIKQGKNGCLSRKEK
jgi:hypothetical protein